MFFAIFIRLAAAVGTMALPMVLGRSLWRSRQQTRHCGAATTRTPSTTWKFFRWGAVAFFASQIVHIPFNYFILEPVVVTKLFGINGNIDGESNKGSWGLAVHALLLGLSAGLFEEVTRWIVYRYWFSRNERTSSLNAMMLGTGHGGCEAFILGLVAMVALVLNYLLKDSDLTKMIPNDSEKREQLHTDIVQYWKVPWYLILMAPLERVYALAAHVSMSLLVWKGFEAVVIIPGNGSYQWRWLVAAIFFHAYMDALAVFATFTWSAYVTEAVLGIAVFPISLYVIYRLHVSTSEFIVTTPHEVDSSAGYIFLPQDESQPEEEHQTANAVNDATSGPAAESSAEVSAENDLA